MVNYMLAFLLRLWKTPLSEEVKKREGAGNTASASGSRHGRNAPDSGNGDLFSTW